NRSPTPEAEVFEKFAIPKAPFKRLSKQILNEVRPGWRLRAVALEALQAAAEGYITGLFSGCSSSCAVRKSSTIKVEDMKLVLNIQECLKRPLGSRLRRHVLRDEPVPSRNRVFSSSTDETNEVLKRISKEKGKLGLFRQSSVDLQFYWNYFRSCERKII
ncbi:unnamed protein product, partial [Allacma fusca]